ncbi:hypothetical protein PPERSA_12829 [Pseudocohnilembus persalinus]|uniref:Uncharacterized protein n=1 Tax=Pseudocohnilembus persalinus TaxID=266149 RepID=A0A0V0QEH3_PSEPJ|nr:hypothetical protein PPERSA_12829 [Pseudocohnilembus persalinus]|eukprot:KRX00610.1 hypothetical protein PPERSA_12829 [Pseudocohnilembus persalinus]
MMSLTPQEYIDNFCKYVQQGDLIQSAKYLKQMIDLRIKINIEYQSHNEQQPSEQNFFNPNDYLVDYEPQPIKIESQDNQKKVEVYSPADFSKYLNSSEPQQVQKQEQEIEIDNNQISDIDTDNELESKLEQVEETKRPEQQLYQQSQQTTNKQQSRTPQY